MSATVRPYSDYVSRKTFEIPRDARMNYQQYAEIYFARLSAVRPSVAEAAARAWADIEVGGSRARAVERALDVSRGQLCWVIGTIVMEYSRKPNVMDDLSKEHWIIAPEEREKFFALPEPAPVEPTGSDGPGTVTGPDEPDKILLEDESGRIQLVGPRALIRHARLATGAIVAVLGAETEDGTFELVDVCAGGPAQAGAAEPPTEHVAVPAPLLGAEALPVSAELLGRAHGKIAVVSGLDITADSAGLHLDLLAEFLTGELGGGVGGGGAVSRLIIAGNALGHASPILSRAEYDEQRRRQRGAAGGAAATTTANNRDDQAGARLARAVGRLDEFLAQVLPSVPVTVVPGPEDPCGVALPQAPIGRVLLGKCRGWMGPVARGKAGDGDGDGQDGGGSTGWLDCVTNPWEGTVDGREVYVTGGQPVDDLGRYVSGQDGLDRDTVMLAARTVEFGVSVPTAPDTLACYPFKGADPFVFRTCPRLYLVGNQPEFGTGLVRWPGRDGDGGARATTRVVSVPRFAESGQVVLLDGDRVEVVKLG